MSKHTEGPWKAIACGGHSVVITPTKPERNDNQIPAYGYRVELGYSVAYPFTDDHGLVRWDFVCFSHADAKLIAAAPDLLAVLDELEGSFDQQTYADKVAEEFDALDEREYSVNITAKQLRAISAVLLKAGA